MASRRIELTDEEADEARRLAEETYDLFKSEPGHYGNSLPKHVIAKLAETAVEKWIKNEGLDADPAFRDLDRLRDPDVVVRGAGLEVKCWRPETWDDWGRCVTPAQIVTITRKCDVVIWAIVDDESTPVRVEIVGWNTPEEVAATDVRATGPSYRPVMNHQIPTDVIRDPDELLSWLRQRDT